MGNRVCIGLCQAAWMPNSGRPVPPQRAEPRGPRLPARPAQGLQEEPQAEASERPSPWAEPGRLEGTWLWGLETTGLPLAASQAAFKLASTASVEAADALPSR